MKLWSRQRECTLLEEVETKAKDIVVRDRTPNYHYIALVCAYQLTEACRRGSGRVTVYSTVYVTVRLVLFLTREPNIFFGERGIFCFF